VVTQKCDFRQSVQPLGPALFCGSPSQSMNIQRARQTSNLTGKPSHIAVSISIKTPKRESTSNIVGFILISLSPRGNWSRAWLIDRIGFVRQKYLAVISRRELKSQVTRPAITK
jgi:hypothetical protein